MSTCRRAAGRPSTSAGGGGSTASIVVAAVIVIGLIIWAVTQGGSSGPAALPSFTIAFGQGTVANPDSIIDSQPSLSKTIPAHLHYVPFDAGVTAIAEMHSGCVQAISGVGNPPVIGAIGINTGVTSSCARASTLTR